MKIVLFSLFFVSVSGFPSPEDQSRSTRSANPDLGNLEKWDQAVVSKYLGTYGYMSKSRMKNAELDGLVDMKSFGNSIKQFQRMAGVKPTGKLNRKTLEMMSMSRCGVEDTVGSFMMGRHGNRANSKFVGKKQRKKKRKNKKSKTKSKSRSKRYSLEGEGWKNTHLKYHIQNYTPDMTRRQVKDSIKRALNIWANYTTLKFSYTTKLEDADLKISFGSENHGDSYPFDGKGGTLAHAFFPENGNAHFDEDETFDYKDGSGVNLLIVAAHEFGHSLGLAHSSVPNSLMAPFYQGYVADFTLHEDDIAGIQQLYGKKNVKAEKIPPTRRPTTSTQKPSTTAPPRMGAMKVCGRNISFDSMLFDHSSNAMYALKGIYYWKIKDDGVANGYPKKIRRFWKRLPGNIQASVYSKTTRRTYFFKGRRIWRYDQNRNLERGFPRRSSDLGLPKNVNAAMQWGSDGNIYVFKDDLFYRFSEYHAYDGSRTEHPGKISKYWNGIPSSPDDAIQWKDGKTYFFKGNQYWRFSGMGKKMDSKYPRGVKKCWIGCAHKTNPSARLKSGKADKASETKVSNGRRPILARLEAPTVQH